MRKILGITGAILGVLVLGLVALPFLIPMESFRGPSAQAASNTTGRMVSIDGDLRLTIYPELGVSAGAVSMANAEGGREPQMVVVDNLVVGVRVLPLLSGRVEVSQIVLEQPVIHLEVSADGNQNWVISESATPQDETATAGRPSIADRINDVGIEELRIDNGLITYYDATTGTGAQLEDVDIALAMPSMDLPMAMEGALTYNGERLEMDANIARPRALLEAESTAAQIALVSNVLNADFEGNIAASGETNGGVNMDIPSLRALSSWSGNPLPPGDNLGALALQANVAAETNRIAFSGLRMTLDGMTITGDLSIDSTNPTLMLNGGMAIDRLNFNNYLTAAGTDSGAADAGPGAANAPLRFDLLRAVNADLNLVVGTLLFQNMVFTQATMGARLDHGLLSAELREMSLYGGSGRGTLVINAREAIPSFSHTLNVSGTDVQAFLIDFMNVDSVTGTGTFNLDLNTRGSTQNEIVNALAGSGNIDFQNGALRGVDLVAIASTIENVVNTGGIGSLTGNQSTTEFTEFGGSFVVQNGIARNDDFLMINPVVRVMGRGEMNLAAQTLDFYLDPEPVASGNVGGVDISNIGVPFRVHGPWTDLSYTPDLQNVMGGVLRNLLSGEGGLFGGGDEAQQESQEGESGSPLENPGEALRGLFGGFGR